MRPMHLGIDLDGVLADFNSAFIETLAEVTGRALISKGTIPTVWDYPQFYGYTAAETSRVWEHIKGAKRWWLELAPLPGAHQFFSNLNWRMDKTTFITSRLGATAKEQSQAWLGFFLDEEPEVVIAHDKGPVYEALGISHVLDDKPAHVHAALEAGCKAILLAQPWNEVERPALVRRGAIVIESLEDFWRHL